MHIRRRNVSVKKETEDGFQTEWEGGEQHTVLVWNEQVLDGARAPVPHQLAQADGRLLLHRPHTSSLRTKTTCLSLRACLTWYQALLHTLHTISLKTSGSAMMVGASSKIFWCRLCAEETGKRCLIPRSVLAPIIVIKGSTGPGYSTRRGRSSSKALEETISISAVLMRRSNHPTTCKPTIPAQSSPCHKVILHCRARRQTAEPPDAGNRSPAP